MRGGVRSVIKKVFKNIFILLPLISIFGFFNYFENSVLALGVCPSIVFSRDLKLGMSGSDVKELQTYLNNNGFSVAEIGAGSKGKETTYFGALTQTALNIFQKTNNISGVYGIFDQATRDYLGCSKLVVVSQSAIFNFTRNLKFGMSGSDVKELQIYLNNNGFPISQTGVGSKGNETTFFGEKTKLAVIKFQEQNSSDILVPLSLKAGTGNFYSATRDFINKNISSSIISTIDTPIINNEITSANPIINSQTSSTSSSTVTDNLNLVSTSTTIISESSTPLVTRRRGLSKISAPAITGVTVPVSGATPTATLTDGTGYTATISWNENPTTFTGNTEYTAVITLTPKSGYTLTGVTANFFTVAGATATNNINAGVITAVFSATELIQLTISAPSLTLSKPYDASTTAAVTAGALSGVIEGDTITVSAIATYDNINVGTGKTITTVYTLAGAQAGNYIKPVNYATTTGAITSAPLTAIGAITGTTQVGSLLTAGTLTPAEATVTYQWQSATTSGGVYSNISGATASTYTLVSTDLGTYIKVVATATGNYSGTATSTATAVILGDITFNYNGGSVTYGTVYNSTTTKVWLDRNLGATRVAQTLDDYLAYGDLFQWGRPADGHQLINRTTGLPVNGTSTPAVATTTPGTNTFIIPSADWSSIDSDGAIRSAYFGKTDGTGMCPTGFRVPTETEINAERLSWSSNNGAGAFASPLKLTVAGHRSSSNGSLTNVGSGGYYWSSTVDGAYSRYLIFGSGIADMYSNNRAIGLAVRCLKD